MRHGSLFSGIGGFDLAAEWMGWENVFHCEFNPFCQKILKHYWPDAKSYGDIKQTDFTEWRGKVDIVSGGFPCQPYSQAGKRKGKADDRHLWPEMLRAIREIQPCWIVGENVPGLLNWERGMVLDEIKADLEAEGFEVFPPLVLPACGKSASHRRERLWIIAYANTSECDRTSRQYENEGKKEGLQEWNEMELVNQPISLGVISDTNRIRQQRREQRIEKTHEQRYDSPSCSSKKLRYSGFSDVLPTPRIFGADDGLSNGVDRVKGLGNAIVPQIAYEIFKAIEQVNQQMLQTGINQNL